MSTKLSSSQKIKKEISYTTFFTWYKMEQKTFILIKIVLMKIKFLYIKYKFVFIEYILKE